VADCASLRLAVSRAALIPASREARCRAANQQIGENRKHERGDWRFSRIKPPQDVLTIPSQRDPLIDFSAWATSRFLICRRYDF
jgi:hypothetical protein